MLVVMTDYLLFVMEVMSKKCKKDRLQFMAIIPK